MSPPPRIRNFILSKVRFELADVPPPPATELMVSQYVFFSHVPYI